MHSPSLPQAEHIECATESKEITSLPLLVTQMWWGVLVGKSSAQRKKVHHLRIKEKQFKTSTTAFLAEGSIEFFIVAKKKNTCLALRWLQSIVWRWREDKVFSHDRSKNFTAVCPQGHTPKQDCHDSWRREGSYIPSTHQLASLSCKDGFFAKTWQPVAVLWLVVQN